MRTAFVMIRKLFPKARQTEHTVGEERERLYESLHISVLDYGFWTPGRFDNKNG